MNTEGRVPYRVNGRDAYSRDGTPTPAQLLRDAGFEPVDDYVLIQRTAHGTRLTSSDDSLNLLCEGGAEFFAFSGGSIYELRVNGHSIVWGEAQIDIGKLRDLGNVADDLDLVWMQVEPGNQRLPRQGTFALNSQGIEHLQTHKSTSHTPTYRYFVDGVEFTTHQRELTGAQIMAQLSEWNPENSLVLEGQGNDADEVVHPTTVVIFEGRETEAHFSVVPPATFGAA
ncbi:hypothetical protein [Xanthomonas campestris]|uniref:hypothetical protein n=1 Tax=Xanthomonas campestris TaxID=339 RepID=UPI001C8637D3|nr:hypothetical protein [Xanthomonas campestris]MCC5051265.1 hypothetical protein [Xanthomonas campestris pv. aberrans]MEB1125961.1 hypothetical protein [Xanthomonas campestris pv. campestris]